MVDLGDEIYPFFQIVDRLADLYVSYRGRFVTMAEGGKLFVQNKKEGDKLVPVKLSNSILCSHVNQKIAVSVFAGEHSAKFICFDVDDGSVETVRTIIDLCEEAGIPRSKVYVSSSGGKGYHVECFFDSLVYVSKMKRFYEWVCFKGNLDKKKVEFRPTHNNAIKLPLSRNFRTGNVCWYLDPDDMSPIKDYNFVFEIQKVSAESFTLIADSVFDELSMKMVVPEAEELVSDLPVVAEHVIVTDELPDLTSTGMTHKTIMAIACHLRCKKMTEEQVAETLVSWYRRQNSDYITDPEMAVLRDIRKAIEWVFSDKFTPYPTSAPAPSLSPLDIDLILSRKNKNDRRVLFVLLYYTRKFGVAKISYERLSRICQTCEATVVTSIARLRKDGVIRYQPGKSHLSNGEFSRDINSYWVTSPKHSVDGSSRSIQIGEKLTGDNFESVYYTTLAKLVDRPVLKKSLTRSEYKKMEGIHNGES